MTVTVTPHVNFRGDARAALEFYQAATGGSLTVVTYKDLGSVQQPEEADQVMWGQVATGSGFTIMAFDVPASREFSRGDESFFVAMRGTDAGEITPVWEKLSEGAAIIQPLGPAAWGAPLYGMLKDKFGITWVIDVAGEYQQ
jgi:PhnB protein